MSGQAKVVQAKRKRLGLRVDGTMGKFVSVDGPSFLMRRKSTEYRLYKPTRKESMTAALQADRLIRTYPHWLEGDVEDHRSRLMRHWIRWQMNVRPKRVWKIWE